MSNLEILECLKDSEAFEMEGPQPLYREVAEAAKFPVNSLGPLLGGATRAIQQKVQSPLTLGAQSVLAAATVVIQNHIDIRLPTGAVKPVSLYLLTIGESGERKSSADKLAMEPIREFEAGLRERNAKEYFQWKNRKDIWEKQRKAILQDSNCSSPKEQQAELDALGDIPTPPMEPILTCEEPTYAALCKTLETSMPGIGIFSDEGGEFIGGHAMQKDNKLRTITGLSRLWDGHEIKRIRVADGNSWLSGKRLSLHLMVQPDMGFSFLSDAAMANQGFLSRFLFTYPSSTMGSRPWKTASLESENALTLYSERLREILTLPLPLSKDGQNSLQPRTVTLSPEAHNFWIEFYNSVESQLGRFGDLRTIAGFANKLCENALRLAAVVAFFEDPTIQMLSAEAMASGIELAQFYLQEALRLLMVGNVDRKLQKAKMLLDWMHSKWQEEFVSASDILQYGPNVFRDKTKLTPLWDILLEYRWLIPCPEPLVIRGKKRLEAYRIISEKSL